MRYKLILPGMLLWSVPAAHTRVSTGIEFPGVNNGISLPVFPEFVRVPVYPVLRLNETVSLGVSYLPGFYPPK